MTKSIRFQNPTVMIAEAVVGRNLETTGHEIVKSVHPHLTMSEAVMEAAAAAYDEVIHLYYLILDKIKPSFSGF